MQLSKGVWFVIAALGLFAACDSSNGDTDTSTSGPGTDVSMVQDVMVGEDVPVVADLGTGGSDVQASVDVPVLVDVPVAVDVPSVQDVPYIEDVGDDEDVPTTVTCNKEGFTPVYEAATTASFGIEYTALNSDEYPVDRLLVQIYDDFDGPTEPGTYVLDGINYADCGLCLLAYSGCTESGCEKTWYAEQGTVVISALSSPDGSFAAEFQNVVFDEVTINSSWVSTPVTGGEDWCTDGYAFDEEIVDPNEAICNRPDVTCVGETVADFSLQNCESEEMVSVGSLMNRMRALWVVATAGWCTYCHEWVPQVLSTTDENAALGLRSIIVLGENASGNQPTLEYCRSYAAQYDDDASRFYIDHNGEYSYATTFENIYVYPDDEGAFGLPWNALIRASTSELVYVDGAGVGSLEDALQGLLEE